MYNLMKKRRAGLKSARAVTPGKQADEKAGNEDGFRAGASSGVTGGGPGMSPGDGADSRAGSEDQFRGSGVDHSSQAISPGDVADARAGDENTYSRNTPGGGTGGMKTSSRQSQAHVLAQHHQKLADAFRAHASGGAAKPTDTMDLDESYDAAHQPGATSDGPGKDAIGESPDEEALESPEVEALEDEHQENHVSPGPGEEKDLETIGDGGNDPKKARGLRLSEAADETDDGGVPKTGGSLRNSKSDFKKPLSKFQSMSKGRR